MKELFYRGGWQFMSALTILLVITTAWFIFHFIVTFHPKQTNHEKYQRRISHGKVIGLLAMIIGICGQMLGLYTMSCLIEERTETGLELTPEMIIGAIKVTMIVTIYGIIIYLFSLLLWFIASTLIKKKVESLNSA
ncbi:hypothetical protein [Carboxylicivirga sp. M1479]|uniref:hypothetical protein n=1 Tax=Carboxylicivirga sp. M1479 TaxID=2594476 RepID=UPI0011777D14|nr:hypothetical protein [Carboxylicivirga sp. M1479]TRX63174.1 hypothetical protein FNN09_18955 [Carboxylicivirga sp. M1479]